MKKRINIFLMVIALLVFTACPEMPEEPDFLKITNPVAIPELIFVQGGTFGMGNSRGDSEGYSDELPVHSVTLSDFYIGKYEVTQTEWIEVMGSNPSNFKGDNLPVEMVSWYDCIVYCNKRSIAEGLTPAYTISGSTNPANWGTVPTSSNSTWNAALCDRNVNGYRLPTEAEWEFACRGGASTSSSTGYKYSGSNTVSDVAWYASNSSSTTHNVGTKAANELGIYDMSGNVFEWCGDWYDDNYYSSSPSNNPTGPSSGTYRVLRGGSWLNYVLDCRTAIRSYYYPNHWLYYVGFRISRTAL